MTKHLLSIFDLNDKEIWSLITSARKMKSHGRKGSQLAGKSLGLIFEKPSTRTSVSFSVAMYELGGFPLILDVKNMQWKRGETVQDTARVLSVYLHGVMFRALKHANVEEFANSSSIPVINGLTNKEHPCQILGDLLTIVERKNIKSAKELKKIKVTFVGDGNNVANSWIAAASILGFTFYLARPQEYDPDAEILEKGLSLAKKSGASINITDNINEALSNADVIYTDVWTSMGEESESSERDMDFKQYQVNSSLLAMAKKDCMVMHCLPAFRDKEITSEVMDGPNSVILEQAKNRLHIQKAVLLYLLKGKNRK
ncbi:MAG: ornithine carbamoyltransferase [Endomicrobiales bacterium]|nr:ornithine carbamoyltransferase [Endomicrobiales bacterium]